MDKSKKLTEELMAAGIDYNDGIEKFMGEAELYQSLLVNFLEDNCFDEARRQLDEGDLAAAEKSIHAMKSVTGTLCMNGLYRDCVETVDALRKGNVDGACLYFEDAYAKYQLARDAIAKNLL